METARDGGDRSFSTFGGIVQAHHQRGEKSLQAMGLDGVGVAVSIIALHAC